MAVVRQGEKFLVIRRSQSVPAPGRFCFPGGGIDADETETQALVREIQEELGVALQPLRRLWSSTTSWGVQLVWWLAHLDEGAILVPNPAEVESIHWLSAGEMLELAELLESNREFLAAMAAGRFFV